MKDLEKQSCSGPIDGPLGIPSSLRLVHAIASAAIDHRGELKLGRHRSIECLKVPPIAASTLATQNYPATELKSPPPLPTELWQEIFRLSITPFPKHSNTGGSPTVIKEALTLMHICHEWRQAAIAYPQLWTQCSLTLPNHGTETTWAKHTARSIEWFTRARTFPITLTIQTRSPKPCIASNQEHHAYTMAIKMFWTQVFRVCPALQLGRLYVGGRNSSASEVSCGLFVHLPGHANELSHLLYRGATPNEPISPKLWKSSPKLSGISLHGGHHPISTDLPLSLYLPLDTLTNLQINHTCNLSPLSWRYIFLQCTNLETAQFSINVNQQIPTFPFPFTVCFPKLKKLRIFVPFCLDLTWFSGFMFPALEYLELHGVDGIVHSSPTPQNKSAILDLFVNVCHLVLGVLTINADLLQLLRHSVSVKHLTIHSRYLPPPHLMHLFDSLSPSGAPTSASLMPHLERLELKRLDWPLIVAGQLCTATKILDKLRGMIELRCSIQGVKEEASLFKEIYINDTGSRSLLPKTFGCLFEALNLAIVGTGARILIIK